MSGQDWENRKQIMIDTEDRMEEAELGMRLFGSISHRADEDSFYFAGDELRDAPLSEQQIRRVGFRRAEGMPAVHAAIYRARPEVNEVVCTRQCYGSVLGVIRQDELVAEDASGKRLKIRVVPFSLPGSDAQRSLVRRLAGKEKNVGFLITANSGVIAFGQDAEEAFGSALMLESYAKLYLSKLCRTQIPCAVVHGYDSVRTDAGEIRYAKTDTPARVRMIHEQIYAKRPEAGAVVHNRSEAALTVSRLYERLYPLYDDYVRLAGRAARIPVDPCGCIGRDTVYVTNDCNLVFSFDDGAYCIGGDEREAQFVARSAERACIAQIAATRLDGANILSTRDVRRLSKRKGGSENGW